MQLNKLIKHANPLSFCQVYLLMHTHEVKRKGWQRSKIEKIQKSFQESEVKESPRDPEIDHGKLPDNSLCDHNMENEYGTRFDEDKDERMVDQGTENTSNVEGDTVNSEWSNRDGEDISEKTFPGVLWDVFRQQDVLKLTEYLRIHCKEFGESNSDRNDFVSFIFPLKEYFFFPLELICWLFHAY